MYNVFLSVMPIFVIIVMGNLIRKVWITSNEFWRNLEKLCYFLLFPSVMINYISQANLEAVNVVQLVMALVVTTCIISFILFYYKEKYQCNDRLFTSIFQGATRYNSYIFIGTGDALYGSEGLEIVAIVSAYMIIFTNITSILIFNYYIKDENEFSKKTSKINSVLYKFATNPLIISSLIGFICNYSGIEFNIGIRKLLGSFSDSALAMCILCLGAELRVHIQQEDIKHIMVSCGIKLIIMPIVAAFVFYLFELKGLTRAIGLLYSSLPCASTSFVLSRQLGGDTESMTSIITLSTIFSIFSISLVMFILG